MEGKRFLSGYEPWKFLSGYEPWPLVGVGLRVTLSGTSSGRPSARKSRYGGSRRRSVRKSEVFLGLRV